MAPQTRSTKPSPGRSTRNSVYGRSPLPLTKPRSNPTDTSPVKTAPAHDKQAQGKATSDVGGTTGTPWLACRDGYGVLTTVAVSETGQGIHVRWYYPEDDCEVDEDEYEDAGADANVDMAMNVDEDRGVTPPTAAAGPSKGVRPPFPQTPMALQPYDAGSVILTPVKKAKPLQPSPPRIGDRGIRCLYEKGGVLRELNGGARIVIRHPVGSSANLSREQVERQEKEREEEIVRVQVEKLLAEKKRIVEEDERFSDSGYEDDMKTDTPSLPRSLRREKTNDTILITHDDLSDAVPPVSPEMETVSNVFRGPHGELLDRHGRQMFGREGTVLIDSTYTLPRRVAREEAFLVSSSIEHQSSRELNHSASEVKVFCRPRFGPEGTELVD